MSGHPDLRLLFAEEELAHERRREMLEHVRTCAECRARVAEADPSALFSLLAVEPVPASVLDRLSERVSEAVEAAPQVPPKRRIATWGSLAASVLLAAALGTYVWNERFEAPRPVPPPAAELIEAGVEADASQAGTIELLSASQTAQVLDLSVGDTQLIMIFDEALDL